MSFITKVILLFFPNAFDVGNIVIGRSNLTGQFVVVAFVQA